MARSDHSHKENVHVIIQEGKEKMYGEQTEVLELMVMEKHKMWQKKRVCCCSSLLH